MTFIVKTVQILPKWQLRTEIGCDKKINGQFIAYHGPSQAMLLT